MFSTVQLVGYSIPTTKKQSSSKKGLIKNENIDEILKKPGEKTYYVPTKFGAMKILYNNYLFTHHFSRNRIARYRCEAFDKSKCPATIVVFNSTTYPGNTTEHNHAQLKAEK